MYGKIKTTEMKAFHRRSLRVTSQARVPPIEIAIKQLPNAVATVFQSGRYSMFSLVAPEKKTLVQ